jgi:hypothetical protein
VIQVGAATETEMKEKEARVNDALHATRAAVEEGIVPGGGVAYLRALAALDGVDVAKGSDEKHGVEIIRKAVEGTVRARSGSTRRPRCRKPSSRPASSTQQRWSARRCRMDRLVVGREIAAKLSSRSAARGASPLGGEGFGDRAANCASQSRSRAG